LGSALDAVRSTQSNHLLPDEQFVAAVKAEKKTGAWAMLGLVGRAVSQAIQANPPGLALPADMIWAASGSRLFIWTTDKVTGRKPKELIGVVPLGTEAIGATVASRAPGAGFGKTYLSITIRGVPVAVEAKTTDAQALAEAVRAVLPPPPYAMALPPPPSRPAFGS
jgi:hypothetical protein